MFLLDLRTAVGNGVTIRPLRAMMNHATTEVFFVTPEQAVAAPVATRQLAELGYAPETVAAWRAAGIV